MDIINENVEIIGNKKVIVTEFSDGEIIITEEDI